MGPEDFPPLLRQVHGAPKVLYVRGKMPSTDLKFLCVVGSRACTAYGRRQTRKLIAGLANYPIAIVSGMALGIDGEALSAALDVGLPTVAVLPSSLDEASQYPVTNRPLARRILAHDGALVSEERGPYKANIHDFPKRDRIMAALSHATLVIEAGEKSGTLITARLALDYNREVLAIPHELDRPTGVGVNRLIKEGATVVRHSDDILEALNLKPYENPVQTSLPGDLTESETNIMAALLEPLILDDLVERADLSAQEASIAISSLQIRGLITERLGKIERV